MLFHIMKALYFLSEETFFAKEIIKKFFKWILSPVDS